MHTHTRTHTHRLAHARTRAHAHTHTHTHTHTHQSHIRAIRAMKLKKRFLKRRKVFKKDLKELTELAVLVLKLLLAAPVLQASKIHPGFCRPAGSRSLTSRHSRRATRQSVTVKNNRAVKHPIARTSKKKKKKKKVQPTASRIDRDIHTL